jgi:hypothetical protein
VAVVSAAAVSDDEDDIYADIAVTKAMPSIPRPAQPLGATIRANNGALIPIVSTPTSAVPPSGKPTYKPVALPPSASLVWLQAAKAYLHELLDAAGPNVLLEMPIGGAAVAPLPLDLNLFVRLERARQAQAAATDNPPIPDEVHIRHKLFFDAINEKLQHLCRSHRYALTHLQRLQSDPSMGAECVRQAKLLWSRVQGELEAWLAKSAPLSDELARPLEGPTAEACTDALVRTAARLRHEAIEAGDLRPHIDAIYQTIADGLIDDVIETALL